MGNTNSVPVDIVSTEELGGLQFVLQFPDNLLSNLWLEPLSPDRVTASLQSAGANAAALNISAMPGQSIFGTQHLARLHFTSVPGQSSSFAPLHVDSFAIATAAANSSPTELINDGRAVVVGAHSLLEARLRDGVFRELVLYGKTGVVYTVEFTTNITNTTWTRLGTVTTTNLSKTVSVGNGQLPTRYYRAKP